MDKHEVLIVGDHESLTLFGVHCQNELAEYTKIISSISGCENFEVEKNLEDLLEKIEIFQYRSSYRSRGSIFKSAQRQHSFIVREYNDILVYLEQMVLDLKIQETQLLKNMHLINEMIVLLKDSILEVEKQILYGESVFQKVKEEGIDDKYWINRLEKRIEDIKITHTIYLQTVLQLNVMLENNTILIDRIVSAITNTIPVWRNQVAMLLGIEKINHNNRVQEKVQQIVQSYISVQTKKKANKKNVKVNDKELAELNQKLLNTVNGLVVYEEKDRVIREKLFNYIVRKEG